MVKEFRIELLCKFLDSFCLKLDKRFYKLSLKDKKIAFLEITAYNKAIFDIKKALKL